MQSLSSVSLPKNWNVSIPTGHQAFDELMGNCGGVYGARPGKLVLLSAQSGTGKTRLCLTVGNKMIQNDSETKVGHFTGEQSVMALAVMGKTMGIDFSDNFLADAESYWPSIEKKIIENNLNVVVIDSFPMLSFPVDAETKKPLDTKAKVGQLADFAATFDVTFILLNHTDKKGNRGGRNELLHLVDVAYTLRMVPDGKGYDDCKVVEFHCDKNREGAPVSRAFPFNGTWDLDCPFELAKSTGNETGEGNAGKVAERKAFQRESLLNNIIECNGKVYRADVESGIFEVSGMAKSGIVSMLRLLTEEGTLNAVREASNGSRGQPAISYWEIVEEKEESIESEISE
jgi:hypothetical protein